MTIQSERTREAVWSVATALVLVVRVVATIALVLLVLGWAAAAFRDSIVNDYFWPVIGAGAGLLVSTYVYSLLRVRYPRRNGWIP
ncbi:hypothetical protein [Gordonia paraffinivorans]|uniref:hypothetical protein n=1 Tax=Gordonia paraffinivorans TaxID=175628 RepID=UPI0015E8130A|nr:hypothetical protein [Gordonia paraffinivorans]